MNLSRRNDFSLFNLPYPFGVAVNHRNIRTHKAHICLYRFRCDLASKVILVVTCVLPEPRKLF